MEKTKYSQFLVVGMALSGITIIVGAFLNMKQYEFGYIIFNAGFLGSLFFSGLEILRLKKIIERLKERI